uniref:NET domain-containing protein n=1 Tax=viral metagenome TaxID=1070528 RepID=A0A6C0KYD8_9ZZZZ
MDTKEYERRRMFHESLKKLHTSEYIDIVRILKLEEVEFSENSNGIFFDVAKLSQKAFEALDKYMHFVHTNRKDLAERERLMNTLQ